MRRVGSSVFGSLCASFKSCAFQCNGNKAGHHTKGHNTCIGDVLFDSFCTKNAPVFFHIHKNNALQLENFPQTIIISSKSIIQYDPSKACNEELYLQHHGVELSVLVQLPRTGEDGGGLACSRGAIEQEMGELVLADKPLDWREEKQS